MSTNPELIRLCKVWDRLVGELFRMELYSDEDFEALKCKMEGDEAELRVGSAPGHLTRVNLRDGSLEYYDEDEVVNEAVKKLMEDRAKAKCEFMVEEAEGEEYVYGVRCEDVKDLEEAFKVLAFTTSMDIRMGDPSEWYGPKFEKLDGECKIEDPAEREVCAVNKLLKKLEERLK